VKVGKGTYSLVDESGEFTETYMDITSDLQSSRANDTRKYSLMLRHGIEPRHIYNQIGKYAHINSFDLMLAKAIAFFLPENDSEACPSCNSTNTKHENGCFSCLDCGWSKCN
jgi:hypothetical protein